MGIQLRRLPAVQWAHPRRGNGLCGMRGREPEAFEGGRDRGSHRRNRQQILSCWLEQVCVGSLEGGGEVTNTLLGRRQLRLGMDFEERDDIGQRRRGRRLGGIGVQREFGGCKDPEGFC